VDRVQASDFRSWLILKNHTFRSENIPNVLEEALIRFNREETEKFQSKIGQV